MKTSFALLLAFGLASCATTPAPAGAAPVAKETGRKAAPEPKPYPLETCLVTGDDLDEMDDRISTVHDAQVFEFCCKPCLKKFRKSPGKYVKLLAQATR